MSSIDEASGAVGSNAEQACELAGNIAASKDILESLASSTAALGLETKSGEANAASERAGELADQAGTLAEALDNLRAQVEALRGPVTGGGGQPLEPPPRLTPAPEQSGAPGYPHHEPHPISWSDLHHVLNGDPDRPRNGGHAWGTGRPGKTEFPQSWDDEDVREALIEVANRPTKTTEQPNGAWFADGVIRGVTVRVAVRPDESVAAGWPLEGPGVKTNPR